MAALKYGLSVKQSWLGRLRLDVGDPASLTAWAVGTAYAVGDYRKAVTGGAGWAYKCIGAGTSHAATEPTWPTNVDEVVNDNGVLWQAYSKGVKVSLHTTTYSPVQDTDDFFTDATNELATAGGYTAGGKNVQTASGLMTITYTGGTNKTNLDCADSTWSAMTNTFRYAVTRVDLGTAALSPLLCYDDLGAQSPSGVDWTYQVNASGLVEVTTS